MGLGFQFANEYLPEVEGPTPVTPFGRLRWPGEAAAPAAATVPQASPLNALPAPIASHPTVPEPIIGDSPTSILSGPVREGGLTPSRETNVLPLGPISVDRSRGLSGQAWLDSQRGQPSSSFDAMVRDAGYAAPPPISSLSRDTGEGPIMPGSERTLFTVGPGENAWIAGDVGARAEQQRRRGIGIQELLEELEQAKRRAGIAEAETLAEDPFARERMQGEMEAQRVALPALVRGKIDRASEQERRTMYLSERKKIDDRYMEEAIKARSAKDENAEYRAAEAHQAAIDALNAAFGLGARMSSNALYQQSGG